MQRPIPCNQKKALSTRPAPSARQSDAFLATTCARYGNEAGTAGLFTCSRTDYLPQKTDWLTQRQGRPPASGDPGGLDPAPSRSASWTRCRFPACRGAGERRPRPSRRGTVPAFSPLRARLRASRRHAGRFPDSRFGGFGFGRDAGGHGILLAERFFLSQEPCGRQSPKAGDKGGQAAVCTLLLRSLSSSGGTGGSAFNFFLLAMKQDERIPEPVPRHWLLWTAFRPFSRPGGALRQAHAAEKGGAKGAEPFDFASPSSGDRQEVPARQASLHLMDVIKAQAGAGFGDWALVWPATFPATSLAGRC